MRSVVAVVVLLIGTTAAALEKPSKDAAANVVAAWAAAVNGGKVLEAIDRMFAPDYVLHTPGGDIRGREALKGWFGGLVQRCPGFSITPLTVVVNGDMVATRWAAKTHGAVAQCPEAPAGAGATIAISRISGGQFVEEWEIASNTGWTDAEAKQPR